MAAPLQDRELGQARGEDGSHRSEVEHRGPADVEQVMPEPEERHGEKSDADLGGEAQPFLLLEAQRGGHAIRQGRGSERA
jgi:hypothetical protein